jgi:hypothetical protein
MIGSMANTLSRNGMRALAALSLSLAFGFARAQDSQPYEADPPDRAARVSYVDGNVSMQPAGEEDWTAAILNRPLTTGDKLWTESGSRAEIQVGPAAVRMDSDTGLSFLNVDDDTIQMRMTAGVMSVSVHWLEGNDHIEVDTPNVAVTLLRPGTYRVEVDDRGDTTVLKISEGEAEANAPGNDVIVHNQQVVTFRGYDQLSAQFGTLGAPDEFDAWSLERDRRSDRMASSRTSEYVSPDVTGYEDLEDNGTWSSEAEYGYVWTPTHVVAGWAPYQFGRWVWVSPWGWTWIDDSPWGYAPFHYGRWASIRNRWCWVPGPRAVRAVYAPALVGWVGSPGSVNVSLGGGGLAWFPLAPREVYVPARRYSPRYVERVNVTNTYVSRAHIKDVIGNVVHDVNYRNRAVPGAVTVVSRNAFTNSERVDRNRVRVTQEEILRSRVSASAPQIAPVRESRLGGTRTYVRPPPQAIAERQVIVKRNPPAADARFVRTPDRRTDLSRGVREAVEQTSRPPAPARTDRPPPRDPQTWRDAQLQQRRQQQDAQREQQESRDQQVREQQARDQQAWREAQFQQRRQQEDAQRAQQESRDQQRNIRESVQQQVERHQRQEVERREVQQRSVPQPPPRQDRASPPPPQPAQAPRAEQPRPEAPRGDRNSRNWEPKSQSPKKDNDQRDRN